MRIIWYNSTEWMRYTRKRKTFWWVSDDLENLKTQINRLRIAMSCCRLQTTTEHSKIDILSLSFSVSLAHAFPMKLNTIPSRILLTIVAFQDDRYEFDKTVTSLRHTCFGTNLSSTWTYLVQISLTFRYHDIIITNQKHWRCYVCYNFTVCYGKRRTKRNVILEWSQ